MTHYIVENFESGSVFGVYAGPTAAAAIRAMLATAGETEAPGEDIRAVPVADVIGRAAVRYARELRSLCPGEYVVRLTKRPDDTEGPLDDMSIEYAEAASKMKFTLDIWV